MLIGGGGFGLAACIDRREGFFSGATAAKL